MARPSMSRDEALALVRRLQDAANRHDVARLMELYDDDALTVSPVFGQLRGRAAITASWETTFATIPDMEIELRDVLVDGDRVAVLGTLTATDRSGWFGLPPTGDVISYRLVLLCTMKGHKIVREERVYDNRAVLERLEKARLDKELKTAAEVQRALLSRTTHAGDHCESIGDSLPCRAIGGDFFELIDRPDGDFGIVLGDVSGKGPPAALLAAMLQGMFVAETQIGDGPAATLARVNRRLAARRLDARFATLVYAVLSPDGRLVYSNAGHNPPALLARDGIRRLATGGLLLGAFPNAAFAEETLQLREGDTLVMFTDGVTEAQNPAGEELGDARLMACLSESAACPPAELLNRVFGAVHEFCQQADQADDITVTVTRFH
jgi:serine phosphatase RsbU (regulator of sigma subunit)/ketosteroid isomerase-like protein